MLVRGDVVAGGCEFAGFEGKTLEFVFVPGVSRVAFEAEWTIETPELGVVTIAVEGCLKDAVLFTEASRGVYGRVVRGT